MSLPDHLICPVCLLTDQQSTVEVGPGMQTSIHYAPYYDKNGHYHHHTPKTTFEAKCSRGHTFTLVSSNKCPVPTCDFGEEARVFLPKDLFK